MTSVEHSKPVRMAALALQLALAGQMPRAARQVERLSRECGSQGVFDALVGWIDKYTDHATDGRMVKRGSQMRFVNAETGALDDERSKRLPDEIRWAGQLVAARAGMDEPKFLGLIDALPEDPLEIGQYVLAVLDSVATTINGLPRGFILMGSSRD